MTVETSVRKQSFNGGQTSLDFTFKTLPDHPEYIKVVAVTSGTETLLTYLTQYTVTIASDGVGGTVIVSPSYGTEYTYTVYRETDKVQESDYNDYNQFPADTVENDMDRLTCISQEIQETVNRCIQVEISDTGGTPSYDDIVADAAAASSAYAIAAATSATLALGYQIAAATSATLALTAQGNAETAEGNAEAAEASAAAYAAAAAASAAGGLYNEIIDLAFSDSPYIPLLANKGALFNVNTTNGNVVINLSALSTYATDMVFAFNKVSADANTITINRGGTNTIDGTTSKVLSVQYELNVFLGDLSTGEWVTSVQSASLADGSVTLAKLADLANLRVIGRIAGTTGVPEAVEIKDEDNMASDSATALATQQSIKAYVDSIVSSGDGLLNTVILSSGTSATWNVPAGVSKVYVSMVGGGGGGGGSNSYEVGSGGGGGASGIMIPYTVTPSGTVTYTIGAGGNGGAAQTPSGQGTAGGATSFGNLTANGGSFGNSDGTQSPGGAGGTVSSLTGTSSVEGETTGKAGGIQAGTFIAGGAGGNADNGDNGGAGGGGTAFGKGASGGNAGSGGSNGSNGTANTGAGGGGGGGYTGNGWEGGDGGSGVIILFY